MAVLAGTFQFGFPWWLWALSAAAAALGIFEERQRAARKARHRAYLRSPERKALRRNALAQAGGRCQDCGSAKNLHVHHLTYKRHGHELDRDLRVLCPRCHRRRHRDGGRIDDMADRFAGWLAETLRARRSDG